MEGIVFLSSSVARGAESKATSKEEVLSPFGICRACARGSPGFHGAPAAGLGTVQSFHSRGQLGPCYSMCVIIPMTQHVDKLILGPK